MNRALVRSYQSVTGLYNTTARTFSISKKFAGIDMTASGAPDRVARPGTFTLADAPHIPMNRKGQGWLKENPIFTEIAEEREEIIEDAKFQAEYAERASQFLESCLEEAIDGINSKDMVRAVAAVTKIIELTSVKSKEIAADRVAKDEVEEIATQLSYVVDALAREIRSAVRTDESLLTPELFLRVMNAFQILPIPVSIKEAYTTELYNVSDFVEHIIDNFTKVSIKLGTEGRVEVNTNGTVPPIRLSSLLVGTFYALLLTKVGLVSGVVHTPHVGLVYAYNTKFVAKEARSQKYIHNHIHYAGRPFPPFGEKLKPCDCKDGCNCLQTVSKHVYLDFLASRVGFLVDKHAVDGNAKPKPLPADAYDDNTPKITPISIPYQLTPHVPFYSQAGNVLRFLCEALYVEDLQPRGKLVLHVAIKKLEDHIKYEVLTDVERSQQGQLLIGTGVRPPEMPAIIRTPEGETRVVDTDSEPESLIDKVIR